MGKLVLWMFLIILVFAGFGFYIYKTTGYTFGLDKTILSKGTIGITTQSFVSGDKIPAELTCDGFNLSPTLLLEHSPDFAKSLAIVLDDNDSKPTSFTHWLAFNISPFELTLEGAKVLGGAVVGTNDFGNSEYDGPCPPAGETHKYSFKVYALDTTLNLTENSKRADFDAAIKNHIISSGQIDGYYTK